MWIALKGKLFHEEEEEGGGGFKQLTNQNGGELTRKIQKTALLRNVSFS